MSEKWTCEERNRQAEKLSTKYPLAEPDTLNRDYLDYYNAMFNGDVYDKKGIVIFAERYGNGRMRKIGAVSASRAPYFAASLVKNSRKEFFLTKLQRTNTKGWKTNNLFCVNAIWVDIDIHSGLAGPAEVKMVANGVLELLSQEKTIPIPNAIEYSGIGVHLVWFVNQAASCYVDTYRRASVHFANAVAEILPQISAGAVASVDKQFASNIGGLVRVAGSWNKKAGSKGSLHVLNLKNRIDLNAWASISEKKEKEKKKECRAVTHSEQAGAQRVNTLLRLGQLRDWNILGQRDLYIFTLFNAYIMAGLSNEEALEQVQKVNAQLVDPLLPKEVKSYLSSAVRKHYKQTNRTIIDIFAISVDEQRILRINSSKGKGKNTARDLRRRDAKRRKYRRILKLLAEGRSVASVAKTGIAAYNTVRSVLYRFLYGELMSLFTKKEYRQMWHFFISLFNSKTEGGNKLSCNPGVKDGAVTFCDNVLYKMERLVMSG